MTPFSLDDDLILIKINNSTTLRHFRVYLPELSQFLQHNPLSWMCDAILRAKSVATTVGIPSLSSEGHSFSG